MEQLIIFVVVAFVLSILEKRAKRRQLEKNRRESEEAPQQENPQREIKIEDVFSSIFGVEKIEPQIEQEEDDEESVPFFTQKESETSENTAPNILVNTQATARQSQFNDAAFNINDYITEVTSPKKSPATALHHTETVEDISLDKTNIYEKYDSEDLAACYFSTKIAGLSPIQQAVIMKEVLDKPLSMRDGF